MQKMQPLRQGPPYLLYPFLVVILLATAITVILSAVTLSRIGDARRLPRETTSDAEADINKEWWKHTPVYQIYPRSFQDSNDDGTGDLRGIKQRIPYLHDLGIKAVWLSPIYTSPMLDFGYDISNFTGIEPMFGTIDDFRDLLEVIHKYGMYLIMDFVPNHTSDQHPWFQKSRRGEEPYSDYYVWRDEPNNWLSDFGNSSWEYDETRGKYYLHQFLIQQPDLNFRNPKVRQEIIDVMRFWADEGIDGFRIDSVDFLVEDAEFRDEPPSGVDVPPNHRYYLKHIYTHDQPENYEVVQEWAQFIKEYAAQTGQELFVCSEAYTDTYHMMKYYSTGVNFPFNFKLVQNTRELETPINSTILQRAIKNWMGYMPAGVWPNWVLSNHDNVRAATRFGGRQYVDITNMLVLLLPGTATVYYGDELGMIDTPISYEETVDSLGCKWGPEKYGNFSRDPQRTPMQWEASSNSGFSKGKPWLPMGTDWQTYNVEKESNDPNSHLSIFKTLVKLRQERAFRIATNLRVIDVDDENVLVFARELGGSGYLVILNIGQDGRKTSISQELATGTGKIVVRSSNARLPVDTTVDFNQPFEISNAEGYVIKLA